MSVKIIELLEGTFECSGIRGCHIFFHNKINGPMACVVAIGWLVVWTVAFPDKIRLFYDIKTDKPHVL